MKKDCLNYCKGGRCPIPEHCAAADLELQDDLLANIKWWAQTGIIIVALMGVLFFTVGYLTVAWK